MRDRPFANTRQALGEPITERSGMAGQIGDSPFSVRLPAPSGHPVQSFNTALVMMFRCTSLVPA